LVPALPQNVVGIRAPERNFPGIRSVNCPCAL
jgi:hypothetical protein